MAITFTLTVHDAPAARVAPVTCPKSSAVAPGPGVQVGEPPQVVVGDGAPDACIPAGRLSENLMPVSGFEPGLVSVNCSVDDPPTATGLVVNVLVSVGGAAVWQPVMVTLSKLSVALAPEFEAFQP